MRLSLGGLLVAGLLVVMAGPASGHPGLVPRDVPPGAVRDAQLVLAHGCGEDGEVPGRDDEASPTRTVTMESPPPLRLLPREVEGWTLEDDGNGTARWTTDDEDGAAGTVHLDVEVNAREVDDDGELWVSVTQECVDGTTMLWGHPGHEPPASEYPAMLVRVDAASAPAGESGGLPPSVVAALVVGLAVVAGGAVTAWSVRRA